MKTLLTCLLLVCLFSIGSSYTLQGAWKLTIDESYSEISPQTEVIFNFEKSVEEGQIVNRLTVYACAVATFTYTLNNENINFSYERTLATRKECRTNEIGEIRRKMDKVYYTVTIANNIFFVSPSGSSVFKLKKVSENEMPDSLAGVWRATEAQQ